jgi:threonine dehydratase
MILGGVQIFARLRPICDKRRCAFLSGTQMSDNEVAKRQVRHMVAGFSPNIANEKLFRFEFPERPGALLDFLNAIGSGWTVSLFHYRNHGSDYGRILAGIDVPASETTKLEAHLGALGYAYREESGNPAHAMFLA